MDNRFLDKVLGQIVSETTIDYDDKVVYTPFISPNSYYTITLPLSSPLFTNPYIFMTPIIFDKHCRDVYGLNIQETEYVWKEYRETIIDKINNG